MLTCVYIVSSIKGLACQGISRARPNNPLDVHTCANPSPPSSTSHVSHSLHQDLSFHTYLVPLPLAIYTHASHKVMHACMHARTLSLSVKAAFTCLMGVVKNHATNAVCHTLSVTGLWLILLWLVTPSPGAPHPPVAHRPVKFYTLASTCPSQFMHQLHASSCNS